MTSSRLSAWIFTNIYISVLKILHLFYQEDLTNPVIPRTLQPDRRLENRWKMPPGLRRRNKSDFKSHSGLRSRASLSTRLQRTCRTRSKASSTCSSSCSTRRWNWGCSVSTRGNQKGTRNKKRSRHSASETEPSGDSTRPVITDLRRRPISFQYGFYWRWSFSSVIFHDPGAVRATSLRRSGPARRFRSSSSFFSTSAARRRFLQWGSWS